MGGHGREIQLTKGFVAIVDDAEFDWLMQWGWTTLVKPKTAYAVAKIDGRSAYMHRLIMETPKGLVTDHINGDGLDNRRANLRVATSSQNNTARHDAPRNRHGYFGIQLSKSGRFFQASIRADKRRFFLGTAPTAEAAARLYDEGARRLHGEFAHLNFPSEAAPS